MEGKGKEEDRRKEGCISQAYLMHKLQLLSSTYQPVGVDKPSGH